MGTYSGRRRAELREGYGKNYERLVEVKTKYDPTNFFRLNANIEPRSWRKSARKPWRTPRTPSTMTTTAIKPSYFFSIALAVFDRLYYWYPDEAAGCQRSPSSPS